MKKTSRTILILLIFLILCGLRVSAQIKKLKWEIELCEFEGTYDSTKYTEAQLRDTKKLLSGIGGLSLSYDPTPRKFEDIGKLSLEQLEAEYLDKLKELQNLKLVKGDFWVKLRQDKIKELNQLYMLSKITMKGYTDPSALKEFDRASCCIDFYAQPLIDGGDYLLTTWEKVNMDTRSHNGNPQRIENIFNQQNASPDKLKYARMEVMTFGWWNCANSMRYHLEYDEKQTEEYNKLFKNVRTIYCDEP